MGKRFIQSICLPALVILLTSSLVFELNAGVSKEDLLKIFTNPKYAGLNTAGKEFYLSEEEKWVVALCNLARYEGKVFADEILLRSGSDTTTREFQSLVQLLRTQKSTFPLMPAFSLYKAALVHAKDMGTTGNTGHISSAGVSYVERIQQFFPSPTGFAENYYAGSGDPIEVVLQLLLGKGGQETYRNNILSPEIHYIGVSIQPHRKLCSNAVLDFARKPVMAASSLPKKRTEKEVYWRDCPTGTKISSRKKSGGFSLIGLFGGRRK